MKTTRNEILNALRRHRMTAAVLHEVHAERMRQDARWGEQNHPNFDPVLTATGRDRQRFAEEYEIPTADRARSMCDAAFRKGEGTWAHIAVEELAEAIGATNTKDLRAELIQVAAVAVAWIEAIDRRDGEFQ